MKYIHRDFQKEANIAAGKLAEVAGRITGNHLNGEGSPCDVFILSDLIIDLNEALRIYNLTILDWTLSKDNNDATN